MTNNELEKVLYNELKDRDFDEILEDFNIDLIEVFQMLYDNGQLDEDLLQHMLPLDYVSHDSLRSS